MRGDGEFFELRLYHCVPGRLADLHHRMSLEVPPIFARHGVVRPIAYWEGFAGPMTPLYAYMLRWQTLQQRMEAFRGFYTDPVWAIQREASNAGREMVRRIEVSILRPSPLWQRPAVPGAPVGGLHELRCIELPRGEATSGAADLAAHVQRHDGIMLGAFDMMIGPHLPQLVLLLAWADMAARTAALLAAPVPARRQSVHLLRPASYGTARIGLPTPADLTAFA